jgi:hypothetical protein
VRQLTTVSIMNVTHALSGWFDGLKPLILLAPAPSPATGAISEQLLGKGEAVHFDDASGRLLRCLAGNLWITHDGDPKDVVLEAGESYLVTRSTRMIVYALQGGRMRLM